jgi:hypothetical protein
MQMHIEASVAAFLGLVLGVAAETMSPASARAQQPVPMKVTVTVGGKTETLRGTGRCGHEPRAWLHDKAAALWLAEYPHGDQARRVSLSYWRLAAGDEVQFSVAVYGKTAAHRISTVKGGTLVGSGRATFQPTAQGGRFSITGKTQNGASLQATIECARFGGIAAEGG